MGSATGRDKERVNAMKKYGGMLLLELNGMTKEWDTSERRWLGRELSLQERIDELLIEGDNSLRELGYDNP